MATRTLTVALSPLVAGWALYALVSYPHRSWYSWVVSSLADAVYLFGFISMTPQLFINYKLKSVAHMPWRVMAYKAFNTFVDDAFALMVSMPTAHRVACLRDDVVFLIFLYQRRLYPVDLTRANEYGIAYERTREQLADGSRRSDHRPAGGRAEPRVVPADAGSRYCKGGVGVLRVPGCRAARARGAAVLWRGRDAPWAPQASRSDRQRGGGGRRPHHHLLVGCGHNRQTFRDGVA